MYFSCKVGHSAIKLCLSLLSTSLVCHTRGEEKGVMVAPVLVDVTRDATPDILVSAFEGVLVLYDGETLQPLWRRQFPGMESYR